MVNKKDLISVGADKLADVLIEMYENNRDMRKQLDIVFAGLSGDPKKISSLIRKEITSLKRSSRFIDYYESRSFSESIDQIRLRILNDLLPISPKAAMDLMLLFLETHEKTLNRVDDSNGDIGDVYRDACQNLGSISEKSETPLQEQVKLVFRCFTNNDYGIYDEIIHSFKNSLGEKGLNMLWSELENAEGKVREFPISIGLKEIADCKKDVDVYINACSITGKPSTYEHLEIAKRLNEHWRGEEALKWLDEAEIKEGHFWEKDRRELRVQALELIGNYAEAQSERITWFNETLDPKVYGLVLKNSKPEFKESFRKSSIKKAFSFHNTHTALDFLIQVQEFEDAANFARRNIDSFNGRQYGVLRTTAQILHEIDPLAATLLYRKLISPILDEAKSKYYNYAAKDLLTCSYLNPKITDWGENMTHTNYFNLLLEKNKRKVRFWSEYESEKQKHLLKELGNAKKHQSER